MIQIIRMSVYKHFYFLIIQLLDKNAGFILNKFWAIKVLGELAHVLGK